MAVVMAVTRTLIIGLFAGLSTERVTVNLPGILLGEAPWLALDARDLRRCQDSAG